MNTKSVKTWTATIFIGGHLPTIEAALRTWVMVGACVTLEPCKYIFTGGAEDGARIGLINYPRFPKSTEELREQAISLAELLVGSTHQLSCSVVMPDETVWVYRPEKEASKLQ